MTAIAGALIIAALVVRGWVAVSGNFYWDDLILIGRASTNNIASWTYLGHSHDGHFMPATFLVAGISTLIAPVNWAVPAVTLIVLQAIASVSVWRMIRVIAGTSPSRNVAGVRVAALAALVFYLFTPMTVPAFAWWAAGLNSLPLQAAMAWIVTDAILLTRDDRDPGQVRTIAIRSSIIFLVALAFFEKSLFILPVAFIAAVLAARWGRRDSVSAVADVFLRARALWVSMAVIFAVWLIVFFSVSDATAGQHSITQTMQLVWRSINNAIVPSLIGGPWEWSRWTPSPPMGFPPVWMIVVGWVVAAGLVAVAFMRRRGAAAVLLCTAIYPVLAQIPAMWNRSSANTALELAQTMRYLPDTAVVFTLAAALLIASPPKSSPTSDRADTGGRHALGRDDATRSVPPAVVGVAVLTALAAASSLIALAGFSSSWQDNPTGPYLATARSSLAANREHPMFDQSLPLEVLLPVAFPQNQISHTFGRVTDRPQFGRYTDKVIVLDTSGTAVDGEVTQRRLIRPGSGTCGNPEITGPGKLTLDGPLLQWQWTMAVSYCANRNGEAEFSLDGGGPAVRVPISAGLHIIYVQLDGRGEGINVRPVTDGLTLHTGEGRVGEVVEARYVR